MFLTFCPRRSPPKTRDWPVSLQLPLAPPLPMQRFYVKRPTGKVFGPFDQNAIRLMLQGNKLGADAEVSTDKETWQPIHQIEAFAGILENKTQFGVGNTQSDASTSLPRSTAGSADLPRSSQGGRGPSLPRPKGSSSAPDLPRPKGSSSAPDLPRPKGSSSTPDLPQSAGADLPQSAGADLPQSAPSPSPPVAKSNDDDLFGAPIEDDDDDLFAPPPDLDEDSDDLFGAPDGLDDDSDDLFGAPDGLDEDSDDLFGAPDGLDEDNDDAMQAPGDQLFGSEDLADDDLDDDLFDSPEMDDDDLFADTDDDDDDFLSGDGGFSFLEDDDEDDDLEDWERDIEPSQPQGPSQPASPAQPTGQAAQAPPSQPHSPSPDPGRPDDPDRPQARQMPASSGIKQPQASATTSKDEAVDADKKRGIVTIIGIAAVGLLLFGGGGFALFQALQTDEEPQEVVDTGPTSIEYDLTEIHLDNYGHLRELMGRADDGELSPTHQGRLLLIQSLFLTRYDDPGLEDEADQLANALEAEQQLADVALGLAAHEARRGQPDAARTLADEAQQDPELAFFAELVKGIADATAHFEGEEFAAVIDHEADDSESTQDDEADAEDGVAISDSLLDEDDAQAHFDEEEAPQDDDDSDDDAQEDTASADDEEINGEEPDEEQSPQRFADRALDHLQAAADDTPTSAMPHYWMARIALHMEDAHGARDHLIQGIEADDRHIPSRLQAAQIAHQQGDLNDAEDQLDVLINDLSGDSSTDERALALHLMGQVHQARQDSELAIDYFTRALSTDSSRSETLRLLAQEYERAEMYEEALNFFRTDENLGQEDPDVILGIVRSHMGLEEWSDAIRGLEEGEESFPEDARFPYNLGVLNEEQGNFYEARQAYERALDLDPELLTARTSLAHLSWRIDEDALAGDDQVRAITERPELIDASIASEIADYYQASDRAALARAWNEEALRLDPNFWPARLALADLRLQDGDVDEALTILERSRDEGVQDVRLSAILANAYRMNEQYDRAIDEINDVIAEAPDNEEYIFIRGRIYYDRGNYATAREDFSNAYDLNPRFHEAYFFVGRTALAKEDFSTATRIFRHVLDYQPDNGEIHYFMGRTFEADGSDNQALDSYAEAIDSDPEYVDQNPDVLIRRARLLIDTGRTPQAARDLDAALEREPDNPEALYVAGLLAYEENNYDAAIDHLRRVVDDDESLADAQYRLGMSYIYRDRDQEGVRHLQQAVRHGYEDPQVYRTMGYLYRDLGRTNDAIDAFRSFLREADDDIADSDRREMLRQIERLGG